MTIKNVSTSSLERKKSHERSESGIWRFDGLRANVRKLGKNEELDPKSRASASVRGPGIVAHIVTKRHGSDIVNELRKRSSHSNPGKRGEAQVPSR